MKKPSPIRPGFEGITPYICVEGAAAAIEFYKKAFDATEEYRMENGDKVGHAELTIFGSKIMLSDAVPEIGAVAPQEESGSPVTLHIYVEDVDGVVARAGAAGARIVREVSDQFYGDRNGMVVDPFGHKWSFATQIEELSPEDLEARSAEFFGED